MQLDEGLEGTVTTTVTEADTAIALGSGDVNVLGTPCVLALAEQAAVTAIRGRLPDERTTVGTWAEVFHNAPSHIGAELVVSARLRSVESSRLEFTIVVTEGDEQVARVEHRRVIVDRSRFEPETS